MAGDTEDLVLSISADVRQMQRALDRLIKDTDRTTKAVQRHFDAMGTDTAGAFDKVAANSNKAANAVQNDAKRMAAAMSASRFQTANLAAQLNDIGVQLAAGQSPFQIALQQGTQITQILGSGGVRGAVTLLGASFAALVNPVSLATIAVIGLGGAAVQYFTSLLSDGEKGAEELKKQADLIQRVAEKWGDAVPALREYVDELKRAADAGDLSQATQQAINAKFAEARQILPDVRSEIGAIVEQLVRAGASQSDINAVRDSFNAFDRAAQDLNTALVDGGDTTEAFRIFAEALAAVLANDSVAASDAASQAIYRLRDAFQAAASAGAELAGQSAAAGLTAENLPTLGAVQPIFSGGGKFVTESDVLNQRADDTKSQTQIEAEKASRRGRRGGRVSDAEREREAVRKLVDELEFEYSLLGKTDAERKIATELRRAGAAATDEQRLQIETLVTAIEAERAAMKESEQAMKALQDIGRDFLGGFVKDLLAGKDASEALSDALGRVADKLLDMALDGLFSGGLFGKGGLFGGFIIPGILHSGGIAGRDGYGHGRSVSPAVFSGATRYHSGGVAGLRPDEVPAILQRGEVVLPRGSRSGKTDVVRVVLQDDSGRMAQIADQRIHTAAGPIVEVSVQQSLKATKQQMPGLIANAQTRQM